MLQSMRESNFDETPQGNAKWNVDSKKCSEIFNKYKIYDYIETCYEFFHIQGDEENFNDINKYLKNNGVEL